MDNKEFQELVKVLNIVNGKEDAIDYVLAYTKDARWDIVARAMDILHKGFSKKINNDVIKGLEEFF